MDDEEAIAANKCPVCGSDPRTHPGLRFKINTKCYHRICEGCVDRNFSSGKAECPVAGCHVALWKREWRTQTFEDLKIEREVEIRKRVNKTLDRQEDEFETKRDYDDFLELREELIMNLVFKTDVAATNRKLREYAAANGIKTDTTEAANEPTKPVKRKDVAPDAADPSGLIKGLKKISIPKAKAPYDPFMGMSRTRDYYEVTESYVARARGKPAEAMLAAGYDFGQYMDECLLRAFAGLGVFIEDEMATKNNTAVPVPGTGELKAADDVF
ncbi:CDK-activating kinase assembly factor MAT1 [Exophiala viscosa]|uniref:CDK-activating kinase assembly factor MAT1 n=1 Tax=Exophiala viscosa TaxID=2486360 RepID=A0AAN6IDP1_9EURO|nr:CDK-activating kinase assembly factor MAT1 [Exophiala viscosa]